MDSLKIGEIYKTKMSDGSLFKVESEDKFRAYGYYVGKEHIGICPLVKERLIIPSLIPQDSPEESSWREVVKIIDKFQWSNSSIAMEFMPCVRELIKNFKITRKNV